MELTPESLTVSYPHTSTFFCSRRIQKTLDKTYADIAKLTESLENLPSFQYNKRQM